MKNSISYTDVLARLKENNIPYREQELEENLKIIITERGGRILGPFLKDSEESLLWINKIFVNPDDFREFIKKNEWNIGGERFWLAPEIQFSIKDRNDFWNTYHLPEAIDPGNYTLDDSHTNYTTLDQNISVTAYNLAHGIKQVKVKRIIRPIENPLQFTNIDHSILNRVIFGGYEQIVTLSEITHNDITCESWILMQLNPGGTIYIPCTPKIEATNYFEPIDSQYQQIFPNYVALKITGDRRYKVGYKSAHIFGRLAYLNTLEDGKSYLLIRNFFNNPSAPYAEEPPERPGNRGYSVHIYNDNGDFGGFGELECNGQPIGGKTGKTYTVDNFTLWIFIGDYKALREIALHLLGIEI